MEPVKVYIMYILYIYLILILYILFNYLYILILIFASLLLHVSIKNLGSNFVRNLGLTRVSVIYFYHRSGIRKWNDSFVVGRTKVARNDRARVCTFLSLFSLPPFWFDINAFGLFCFARTPYARVIISKHTGFVRLSFRFEFQSILCFHFCSHRLLFPFFLLYRLEVPRADRYSSSS